MQLKSFLCALTLAVLAPVSFPLQASGEPREPWPVWRRGDGYTFYERRRTRTPERGFEGFAGPPMNQSYCSYRRIPHRECGPKGCRVTSWTLEQYCQ
ncbi:MAG: hypothetical protein R3D44_06900 [Hyphomicrobiaceae bacterium]